MIHGVLQAHFKKWCNSRCFTGIFWDFAGTFLRNDAIYGVLQAYFVFLQALFWRDSRCFAGTFLVAEKVDRHALHFCTHAVRFIWKLAFEARWSLTLYYASTFAGGQTHKWIFLGSLLHSGAKYSISYIFSIYLKFYLCIWRFFFFIIVSLEYLVVFVYKNSLLSEKKTNCNIWCPTAQCPE